ncbi:MAG: hypothetical protein JW757_04775, partial [Anaerolineales bacterium]|nr:hypothetical protein [Anaerolineales bacterium]
IVLTSMTLTWPSENGRWDSIFIDGQIVGNPNFDPTYYEFIFREAHLTDRTFDPGASKEVVLDFKVDQDFGTYTATFSFDNGCTRP